MYFRWRGLAAGEDGKHGCVAAELADYKGSRGEIGPAGPDLGIGDAQRADRVAAAIHYRHAGVEADMRRPPDGGDRGKAGIGGGILVLKLCGALAEKGGSLEQVYQLAQQVNRNLVSLGSSLERSPSS